MFAAANKKLMGTASQKINWHYEALPRKTKEALIFLSKEKWLAESSWYLAGGTALALQYCNRRSFDLDFFTEYRDFDEKKLIAHLTEKQIDKIIEDSFPASDPPSTY